MKKALIFMLTAALAVNLNLLTAQIQTGVFRTPSGNTDYHHFTNNNVTHAAVYINQLSTGPILKLSSETSAANVLVKFTFLSNGNLGIGKENPGEKLTLYSEKSSKVVTQYLNGHPIGNGFNVGIDTDASAMVWHSGNKQISFGTNDYERMRINANGAIDFLGATNFTGVAKFSNSVQSFNGAYKIDTTGVFQSKGYRTISTNTNYHHFIANHETNSAVFINQVTTTAPILRLSSGTATFNSGIKFSFEGSGNLGLGTTTVAEKLVLYTGAANPVYTQYGNTKSTIGATDKSFIVGVDGDGHAKVQHRGAFSIAFGTSNTERMRIISNGNVGIGTTTPDYKLDVVGVIRAHSVQISTAKTADFVFEEDYPLMPLPEVEKFIAANKHLPEVAPAAEMLEKGVDMGEMQIKLLQKVEELTLYVIKQQKEIEELKEMVKAKN